MSHCRDNRPRVKQFLAFLPPRSGFPLFAEKNQPRVVASLWPYDLSNATSATSVQKIPARLFSGRSRDIVRKMAAPAERTRGVGNRCCAGSFARRINRPSECSNGGVFVGAGSGSGKEVPTDPRVRIREGGPLAFLRRMIGEYVANFMG